MYLLYYKFVNTFVFVIVVRIFVTLGNFRYSYYCYRSLLLYLLHILTSLSVILSLCNSRCSRFYYWH